MDYDTLLPRNLEETSQNHAKLSTVREASSIPRSPSAHWQYPSPAMFHSALARKKHPVDPEDIPAMLTIHNALNEQVWREIMSKWEQKYVEGCGTETIKLKRFWGRPGQLTPMAWWYWLVYDAVPYDRHDWVVERCGREVRYVIDYYEESGQFSCVIRPALDSFRAIGDRIRALFTSE